MVLVFAVIYILQGFINANANPTSNTMIFTRQTSIVPDCVCPDTRSKWDIVWSCLVTIFACSWVSVHPNISGPGEGRRKKVLRRLELLIWSIISPELITFWAAKQWVAARHFAQRYCNHGWTKTHGYFIQMGGFMLYSGNEVVGILTPEKFEHLLKEGRIAMPTITETEIKDRSKGDGLSKSVVIVQTTWFITQCVARRVRGLVITELELVTLAFAAFNAIMYTFWWNKPLDVTTTVPVYFLGPTLPKTPTPAESVEQELARTKANDSGDSPLVRENEAREAQGQYSRRAPIFSSQMNVVLSTGNVIDLENPIPPSEMHTHQGSNGPNTRYFARQAWWLLSGVLFRWPESGIQIVLTRMGHILGKSASREGKMRVNTFYAYDASLPVQTHKILALFFALPLVGILFGSIHCAGWNFVFPSIVEANVWRVSSAIITAVPAIGSVLFPLAALEKYNGENIFLTKLSFFVGVLLIVMLPVYVLARIALLVEALISLRDLPVGALAMVEWTSFLPHV